ncbi:MAG TPA: hypothetical protein VK571_10250, partial [Gemmatimonadaceae bacterium]|nr:hypothetical protein [Gemmatimonadaceae bacterium]
MKKPGALLAALMAATACSEGSTPPVVLPPTSIHVVALATYDGSGEAVHPDVADTPAGWDGDGDTKQLFVTPYPNGDASKENPSLFTRTSSLEWLVPNGVMNPIARPDIGYLSDPDQVFNPETNELWLYYRGVNTQNEIFLIRGSGPSRWSAPELVASAPNHSIVSPSVVR